MLNYIKQGISLILLLCIFLTFIGCHQSNQGEAVLHDDRDSSVFELTLSNEMKQEIRTAYYAWFERAYGYEAEQFEWQWEDTNDGVIRIDGGFRYYGTFDNCIVWYSNTDDLVTAEFEMAGTGSFYVYIDGKHYSLKRVYQQELISEEDIAIVAERHRVCKEDYRYYGTYGDCNVWFLDNQDGEVTESELAGSSFTHKKGARFYVYRNDENYTLEQAFQKGWLTKEDVAAIAVCHYQKSASVFELSLSDEMKEKIRSASDAWYEKTYGKVNDAPPWFWEDTTDGCIEHEGTRYYGTFDDCIVWCVIGTVDVTNDLELAGSYFSNGSFFVYHNGNHYSLKEAYEQGLIAAEDIAIVAERHRVCTEDYRCYGIFGDYTVWFLEDKNSMATEFDLANEHFAHPNVAEFYVSRNGERYSLQQAYEQGLLTAEDIAIVAERHKAYNDAAYG